MIFDNNKILYQFRIIALKGIPNRDKCTKNNDVLAILNYYLLVHISFLIGEWKDESFDS